MNELDPALCKSCGRYEKDCPLHGMTDFYDEPLEGYMIECIYYERKDGEPCPITL